ncbi:hypothetical protein NE865_07516 [Phthorimaea operculella]|nr:hypothetical protein NE865_07516 [Phthorimaea operculella]
MGCGHGQDTIEFKSHCASTVYTCYGSWTEGGRGFLIAAPAPLPGAPNQHHPHPRTFCFMYTVQSNNDTSSASAVLDARGGALSLSGAQHSCDRSLRPGLDGDKAYNLTMNGTCEQSSKYNSAGSRALPAAILMTSLAIIAAGVR